MRKGIGLLLIVAGLLIVFYPQLQKIAFDRDQKQLVASFEQLGDTELLEQLSSNSDEAAVVQEYTQKNDEQSKLLDGARGIMKIDKIDFEMVVFEGDSPAVLSKGIGMIEPEKEFGVNNIGLAGHRALSKGKQFNRLGELRVDDEIEVMTRKGIYNFVIVDTFVVHQSEVSVLKDTEEPLITLVTCTPLGTANPPDRLIVQAKLKK
ncbi:class D sortase [Sporosarcina limicola]|uniref:Sortase A n=1 Tax=Sporosarcina limicola TaxID=34101 RepID=A0A927MSN0_9BACL|nr:class D sortase [Sporosarcina limicola]MBE1556631.1 sortase A [Sporosarcina limicola]